MGGKSFFCDYCCCYMKNDVNVRKVHNTGLTHKIAKVSYMRRFEDPRKLLAEESAKVRCTRHMKGFCKFDLFCQFSHFNEKQFLQLRKIVNKLEQKKPTNTTSVKLLSWSSVNSTTIHRKRTKLPKRLPPSLKPINLNKLNEDCFKVEWG